MRSDDCEECKHFDFESGVYICRHHEIYAREKSAFEPCEWLELPHTYLFEVEEWM